jgi:hypothetical protein
MAKKREGYHDLFVSLPNWLYQALLDEATANERTVTGQLTLILKKTYPDARPTAEPPADKKTKKGKK